MHLLRLPIPLLMLHAFSPGHPKHRRKEETIPIIRQPNERDIPRLKRGQQTKKPAGLDDRLIWFCSAVAMNIANGEQEEVDGDSNERTAEDEGGF